MALGLSRDALGDILEEPHAVICLPELEGFIAENLSQAGRVHIKAQPVSLSELPARRESWDIKSGTVASLRLDAVLAMAFALSRGKAAALIESGRVSLDHILCLSPANELREGSLISARGLGRAKLLELGGLTKKGRLSVKIGLTRG
jgi:RNA-binding protein YlmH